jgi:hypothetical protein
MANNVNIKVLVDDAALEKLTSKAQQSAKIIRGGFDIATGAAAVFGNQTAEAFEKIANRSIIVANTFNGLEDLIEGLGKSEGFLNLAQKLGVGKSAVEGFAAALPGIGIAASIVIPVVAEYWDDLKAAIDPATESIKAQEEQVKNLGVAFQELQKYSSDTTKLLQAGGATTLKILQQQLTDSKLALEIAQEGAKRAGQTYGVTSKEFSEASKRIGEASLAVKIAEASISKERERLREEDRKKAKENAKKVADEAKDEILKKQAEYRSQELPLLKTLIFGEETLNQVKLSEEDKEKLSNAVSLALTGITNKAREDAKNNNRPAPLLDLLVPTPQEITELELTVGERAQLIGEKISNFLNSEAFQQSFAVFNNITSAIYDNLQVRLDALSTEKEKALAIIDDFEKKALEKANDNEIERARIQKDANARRLKAEEDYAAKEKELRKKQADIQLAVTIAQILATQAKAITEAISVSPPLGFILAGLVGTATAIQLSSAIQQRNAVAKLGKGGTLFGPSHSEGGIRGTGAFGGIEVEGGEMIINKRSARMYGPLLSRINQAGGGIPLIPTKAANGAVLPGGSFSDLDYDRLAVAIANTPIRAYVVTQDITDAQDKVNIIQRKANLF